MDSNNVGKWNDRYKNLDVTNPVVYGDRITYMAAAKFLSDCAEVEDWGCGSGGFMYYRPDAIGVDGSDTVFAKKKFVNLCEYFTHCESIHIRHILEHDIGWQQILKNAVQGATRKLVVTMFLIPVECETHIREQGGASGVDDSVVTLQISRKEFMDILNDDKIESIESKVLNTGSCYGTEEIFYITMKQKKETV